MGTVPCRSRCFESAAGFLLLAALFLIGVGVFIKQGYFDSSRFGMGDAAAEAASPRPEPSGPGTDPLSFDLPAEFTAGTSQSYTSDNLYEKIDGKAPFYTEAGFERLYTQLFMDGADEQGRIELYLFDMGTALNAFSVYSRQKRPDSQMLDWVRFGYRTSDALFFACGRHYVELYDYSENGNLSDKIIMIAKSLRSKLACGQGGDLPQIELFDTANLVAGSIKYYPDSAFGFECLRETFVADYELEGKTVTAFFSERRDSEDAWKFADEHYKFLLQYGGKPAGPVSEGLEEISARAVDLYGEIEIVFAVGRFVGGVHAAEDLRAGEEIAVRLKRSLEGAVSKSIGK